ncbi:MAG: tagaturonate reductase [Clostridia bacterium]|nr:tagaturonate reductase [Clostridia bacterium]
MANITDYEKKQRPVKVLQFGEGGFLRGFIDWMIKKMNDCGAFDSNVVVVQPIKTGLIDKLNAQNGLYTHIIRGSEGSETTLIDVIDSCINPYDDFSGYLDLAKNKDLRFIFSNTTEAGITFDDSDKFDGTLPKSFPAKLTVFLHKRFEEKLPGFIIIPCELIDRNGDKLKEAVLKYAELWNLSDDFISFINNDNVFCNTLVDRINTGYPKDEKIDLPYKDEMLNTSEYFHLFVIETDYDLEKEIPFSKAGLNVIVTKDALERYRTRKVRILNGSHTSIVCYGLLNGLETIGDCMNNQTIKEFLSRCLFDEIIPTLDLPSDELKSYAESVLVRFANPYINHYLSSIVLNSVSKFKVRVLPSIKVYKERFGKYPENLVFGFSKLIEFYKKGTPNDAPEVIDAVKNGSLKEILSNSTLWGEDLSDLEEALLNANPSLR